MTWLYTLKTQDQLKKLILRWVEYGEYFQNKFMKNFSLFSNPKFVKMTLKIITQNIKCLHFFITLWSTQNPYIFKNLKSYQGVKNCFK